MAYDFSTQNVRVNGGSVKVLFSNSATYFQEAVIFIYTMILKLQSNKVPKFCKTPIVCQVCVCACVCVCVNDVHKVHMLEPNLVRLNRPEK